MRDRVCRVVLAAFLLVACGGAAAPKLEDQLVIGTDNAAQRKLYATIHARPVTDDAVLVSWLQGHLSKLQPLFALELSRRLFDKDRDAALDWYYVAQLRFQYAVARCTDPDDPEDLDDAFSTDATGGPVADYVEQHGQEALAAFRRAAARRDVLDDDSAPDWACSDSIEPPGSTKAPAQGPVKPPAAWPAIRQTVLDRLPKQAAAMEQALKDKEAAIAAAATRPHVVPVALLSGTRIDKIAAIGAEALATIAAMPESQARSYLRLTKLLNLAEAQIGAGDASAARATLAAAQPGPPEAGFVMPDGRIATLWVKADGADAAASYVASLTDPVRHQRALGAEGTALARTGNHDAALRVLDTLGQMPATPPPANLPAARAISPRDLAIRDLGAALVEALDIDGAAQAADLIAHGPTRAGLLADIAVRQCQVDDTRWRATLDRANRVVGELQSADRRPAAEVLAYGFASCDAVPDAVAVARTLVPGSEYDVIVKVADRLTKAGDGDQARKADAALAAPKSTNGLLQLAQRQIERGDTEPARKNLVQASQQMRDAVQEAVTAKKPASALVVARAPLGGIVAAQAKIGAYVEAVRSVTAADASNRPQFLATILSAAAEHKDGAAVDQILPDMLDASGKALPAIADRAYERIGLALARAGYGAQARQVLARATGRTEKYAEVQAALGDAEGARATVNGLPGSEESHARSRFDLALSQSDLAAAAAELPKLTDSLRDYERGRLSDKQAKAADLAGAMTSAWQVETLTTRADALVRILENLPT